MDVPSKLIYRVAFHKVKTRIYFFIIAYSMRNAIEKSREPKTFRGNRKGNF